MSSVFKSGDLAVVVSGSRGTDSPNIGLVVKLIERDGFHSVHKNIWLCESRDAIPNMAIHSLRKHLHFAEAWLKKYEPPPVKSQEKKVELVE